MKKTGLVRVLLSVLVICLCLSSNAIAAGQHDIDDAMIAEELRALSTAVDNLAKQMANQAESEGQDTNLRKLDIAISYLNFRSRRIEMFERDMQSMRTSRNRLEDILEQFKREEDSLSQSFDSNQREAIERTREGLSFRRQAVKDRISRMDEEIILLENRIMDMQSQIDSVESFVQKNLEF
ncbi:MAG: hypothetical protein JRC99_00345 [Deltaproteobacteria bacterium]|nr:hypothetical protein [Deltaproteobacteria bacterium]